MVNRRAFLKTGAATLPLAAAVEAVHANLRRSAGVNAEASGSGGTAELVPLPPRLAPSNPATLAWQQNIFRAGQSNMTERDPAVMKVEEWADYWHSAGAQIVFVSVTGILAFIPRRCSSIPGKVPEWTGFFRGVRCRGQEATLARCRPHEPRFELV